MLKFVLAVIAAAIFVLIGFRVIEDTVDVAWLGIGLAFLALAVAVEWVPERIWRR